MEQRLDLVTLGVRDLAAARSFYLDALGWEATLDLDEVVFIQVGHGLLLALFGADDLDADALGDRAEPRPPDAPPSPLSLAQTLASAADVDATVERMAAAGGTVLKAPQRAEWGGYHAYVADPDGFRWEIAHNPGLTVSPDGTVTIGTIES